MPFAQRDGVRLYWKLEGSGERPTLLLLNSIGTDMALWDRTAVHLLPHFQLLRMDTRGHGASDASPGDYSLAGLAADAVAVMDSAGIDRAAVAGVSLGGMIAMELALAAPERVSALALICTSARMDRDAWEARVAAVREKGTEGIADLAMGRFLSPEFASTHADTAETIRRWLTAMPDDGYAGAGAAIRDMDLADRIGAIAVPTLVVTGSKDVSTPADPHGQAIVDLIPGASMLALDCAHLAPVEAPAALASALVRFFAGKSELHDAQSALREAGLVNRRRVLGDAWVDRSLERRTAFTTDFQDFITRVAWHEIWGRPGLDEKTRRMLVVAVTAALGRWEEFRLHVRAGLEQGGFTVDELKEVLMQLAIYAGVPAANTSFTEAGEIIEELGRSAASGT